MIRYLKWLYWSLTLDRPWFHPSTAGHVMLFLHQLDFFFVWIQRAVRCFIIHRTALCIQTRLFLLSKVTNMGSPCLGRSTWKTLRILNFHIKKPLTETSQFFFQKCHSTMYIYLWKHFRLLRSLLFFLEVYKHIQVLYFMLHLSREITKSTVFY